MKILLFNAGSSSLKAALMDAADGETLAQALADWAGTVPRYTYATKSGINVSSEEVAWKGYSAAVHRFVSDLLHTTPVALSTLAELNAVGHRVVHGGEFTSAVKITPEIRARISALTELAPLHNPPSLETLAAAEDSLQGVPQVAVFDTAFHATLSLEARTYPVPAHWTRDWKIRRYGFHGLSHAYCAERASAMLSRNEGSVRLVICHLGHGCSASAVHNGRCVDTTMGFTPLEGLMMATRSGSIDPGIVLYVQNHHGLTPNQIDRILNKESGLLGVSGISADMRQVLAEAKNGNENARLAVAMYTYRVRQAVGALAVTMGGIDALVFTAGVGEHAVEVRKAICTGLECLGLELDQEANASCHADSDIAQANSRARILIIATREDVMMLRGVVQVLAAH